MVNIRQPVVRSAFPRRHPPRRPIAGADELVVAVRERQPGETVPVELVREGRPLTLSVVLASD